MPPFELSFPPNYNESLIYSIDPMQIKKGIYKHFKGQSYEVPGQAKHSETEEALVVYKPLYESDSEFWVRPIKMFFDTKELDGKQVPRFELVEVEDSEK